MKYQEGDVIGVAVEIMQSDNINTSQGEGISEDTSASDLCEVDDDACFTFDQFLQNAGCSQEVVGHIYFSKNGIYTGRAYNLERQLAEDIYPAVSLEDGSVVQLFPKLGPPHSYWL